jgi:cytochrome c biogenesis protein ResB
MEKNRLVSLLKGKIVGPLKSIRLTAIVIALLIGMYVLGLLLPQKWMFEGKEQYNSWINENIINRLLDMFGFTDIYLSPLTVFLLIVFFLNLIVVTAGRIPVILKRAYIIGRPGFVGSETLKGKDEVSISIPEEDAIKKVSDYFIKRRWYIVKDVSNRNILAVRNRFSPLGFLLFHMSFFLCLVGALLIMYTRFSGNLVLTEGQSFKGDIRQFRSVSDDPKIFRKLPDLGLYLEKVRPYYEGDVPTELETLLQVRYEGKVMREEMKVNQPVRRGAYSIIVNDVGVSPLFDIRGPSGQHIDAAYVSLNVLHGAEDSFRFDTDPRYTFHVLFYPDYDVKDGAAMTRSIELRHPVMHLMVEKEGKKIYDGIVEKGEYADITPYSVGFNDIRYWTEFHISREYGKSILVSGFICALAGLIMRLVFYQKTIRMAVETRNGGSLLYMSGKSEYFPLAFAEEVGKIIKDLSYSLRSDNSDI